VLKNVTKQIVKRHCMIEFEIFRMVI